MTEEELDELIDGFLSGKLSEEQLALLRSLQQSDPDFQLKLKEQLLLWEAVGPSKNNAFRKAIAEVLAEQPDRETNIRKAYPSRRFWTVAATLAILLIIAWWLFAPASSLSGPDIFARSFSMPSASSVMRAPGLEQLTDDQRLVQNRIDSLYNLGLYSQTLDQLLLYGQRFPQARSSDYYFLQGVLYLAAGKVSEAQAALNRVEVGYPYDQKWYLALAHLKIDDRAQAEVLLDDLSQSANPYQDEAAAILKDLSQ